MELNFLLGFCCSLGAQVATDGKAIVGLITDDPNVGPPPVDFVDIEHLTVLNGSAGVFGKSTVSIVILQRHSTVINKRAPS